MISLFFGPFTNCNPHFRYLSTTFWWAARIPRISKMSEMLLVSRLSRCSHPTNGWKTRKGGNCCSAAASQRLLLLPPHLILICCRNSSSSPVLPPWPIVAEVAALVLVISRAFSTFGPAFESYLGGKAKTLWKGRSNSGLSSFSYCAKPRQELQKSISPPQKSQESEVRRSRLVLKISRIAHG